MTLRRLTLGVATTVLVFMGGVGVYLKAPLYFYTTSLLCISFGALLHQELTDKNEDED